MIALHLDATYAEHNTWREFALCFLKLSQYEEDRMSVCLNKNEDGQEQPDSIHFTKTPKIFTEGNSGKSWRLRCRWWLTRHFSSNVLVSEIAAGIFHYSYQENLPTLCYLYYGVQLLLILSGMRKLVNHGDNFIDMCTYLITLC